MRPCSTEGCDGKFYAKDLCRNHYAQLKRKLDLKVIPSEDHTTCIVSECGKKVIANQRCERHYRIFKRHGLDKKTFYDFNYVELFESKLKRNEASGCLEFTGTKNLWGYGLLRHFGKNKGAHRFAYEIKNGPIPSGMFICHHCDNPPCCEVSHLFLGTALDNNLDKIKKNRHNPRRSKK